MTRQEQREFVEEIITNLHMDMVRALEKAPEHWDGRQLRQLLTDLVDQNYNYRQLSGKLLKDYKNEVRVNNII